MHRLLRSPLACLTTGALLMAPISGMGESRVGNQASASASVDIRIVVPPIMRVLENSHPTQMDPLLGGDWSAEQRLVVLSTMKRGFCVTLHMNTAGVDSWRLQTEQVGGITLNPVAGGYRLCTPRPGRYSMVLRHDFGASGNSAMQTLSWPVRTDISAI